MSKKEFMDLYEFNKAKEIIYAKLINLRESGIESNHLIKFTDDWLLGFWEAEGSLYIVRKSEGRYSHGLGISQKKDQRI